MIIENVWLRRAAIISTIWVWYPWYFVKGALGISPVDMSEIHWEIKQAWSK